MALELLFESCSAVFITATAVSPTLKRTGVYQC